MQYNEQSADIDLIKGYLKNDRYAQKFLYKRFYNPMMRVCLGYTRNREEAVEVLNDSFLKVFQELDNFKGNGALGAWIRKIVFYTAIDYVRKNTMYKKLIDLEAEAESKVDEDFLDRLSAEELMELIQRVSPASQTVFSLYAIE